MMEALKEYNEIVWKPGWKWVRKHWKGYTVFCVLYLMAFYVWFFWDGIKAQARDIKVKFNKSEEKP